MNKGFTLAEIIIILIIIGVLAGLALPSYTKGKERALGKEAQANLILMGGAQRNYKMETNKYCNSTDVGVINDELILSLVDVESNSNATWDYNITGDGSTFFSATAARNPKSGNCTYFLNSTELDTVRSSGDCP